MTSLNNPGPGIGRFAQLYRVTWWVVAGAWAAVGAVVAVVSVARPLVIFVVVGILAVAGAVEGAVQSARYGRFHLARSVTLVVVTIPAAMAVVGWVALIAGWALLMMTVLAVTQPDLAGYSVYWMRRGLGRDEVGVEGAALPPRPAPIDRQPRVAYRPPEVRPPVGPDPTASRLLSTAVPALSDGDLCYAWRISFLALERLSAQQNTLAQGRLVHLRQLYLDEMERRNPQGFSRWLTAGARPASDPTRYVFRSPAGGQAGARQSSGPDPVEA